MANNTGKKHGGRQTGTPNRNAAIVRSFCNYIVNDGYEKFKTEFEKLKGKEYVDCFLKLAKIATDDASCHIMANKGLLEMFNEKIKKNETENQSKQQDDI